MRNSNLSTDFTILNGIAVLVINLILVLYFESSNVKLFSAPKFIYSFETDEHVYFVFQEIAVETSPEVKR